MKSHVRLLRLVALSACALAFNPAAAQLPPTLTTYQAPRFPAELKGSPTSDGFTTVAYVVRSDGEIEDAVVLEATHAAFARAVMEVLPFWRFESSLDMVPRREVLRLQFSQTDAIKAFSHLDAAKAAFPLAQSDRLPIRTVTWAQLAAPPKRLSSAAPQSQVAGKVAVSYVIDTEGRVRVPAVLNTTDPQLALAVVSAVKQWRFTSPKHDGSSVLVEDVRSFTFAASAP